MNSEIKDIGKDIHGHHTLDRLSSAEHFNNWIYQTIRPWIKGNVFELGSGIGNISSMMINDGHQVTVTETDETYLKILQAKLNGHSGVMQILALDLVDPEFDNKYQQYFKLFDTVIAINVIEHIEDDFQAFENAKKMLRPDGNLIVLVPSGKFLYNGLDRNLSHFRRYSESRIDQILHRSELKRKEFFYFNTIGMAGWFFSGNVLRNDTIPSFLVNVFEWIIPYTSWLDKIFRKKFGLSLIVVAGKRP
jgi:2-polyprenyl-3-methyl-5-hydroxy-6-metoxy-1,4-benzoquinol methylase